jgi:hypothetical protein
MFGAGVVGVGDIYIALLIYCLLLSICLKLGAVFARARALQAWAVPSLRFLWPVLTVAILVSAVVFPLGLALSGLPSILVLVLGVLCPVSCVGAVFYLAVTEPERWREITLRKIGMVAVLCLASVVLSAGLCVFYFLAKYTFLVALILLTLYSTRFGQDKAEAR